MTAGGAGTPAARQGDGRPSCYARMAALAERCSALNLSVGVPDDDPPPVVADAARRAVADGRNQYAPSEGLPELRSAIAEMAAGSQGVRYDPATEVTVTAGCSEGLVATLMGLLGPGDEVLVLEPFYDYYQEWARMAGGRLVPVPLAAGPAGFTVDHGRLAAAVGPRTRALLLNVPHNPTGACPGRADLEALADLALRADLVVVVDEVYEHFTYAGPHRSIAAVPGMRDRVVVVSSVSKTFSATGWRVGWTLAAPALSARIRHVHRHLSFCAPTPLQAAAAAGLAWARGPYLGELRARYRARRDVLRDALAAAGLPPLPAAGGMFLLVPCPSAEPDAFCEWLATEAGVVPLPMPTFYADPSHGAEYVRFSFCRGDDVLAEAARRLRALPAPLGA